MYENLRHVDVISIGRRFFFVCALAVCSSAAVDATVTWADVARGGYIIVMRHTATTPGVGDPPGFTLKDCATQRNLSAEGRAQAARWAEAVSKHRIPVGEVYSSEWCRCIDTARLAFGRATPWTALNSTFDEQQKRDAQIAEIRKRLPAIASPAKNTVLVTHGVNITALTGMVPQMGEAVVMRLGKDGTAVISGRLLVE